MGKEGWYTTATWHVWYLTFSISHYCVHGIIYFLYFSKYDVLTNAETLW